MEFFKFFLRNFDGGLSRCLSPTREGTSADLVSIKSEKQQKDVEKAISLLNTQQAEEVWTRMKVQKKTFRNSTVTSIRWVDDKNRLLPYANFADNQNPVGIACVLLSKNHNYKWITRDCFGGAGDSSVCITEPGEWSTSSISLHYARLFVTLEGVSCIRTENLIHRFLTNVCFRCIYFSHSCILKRQLHMLKMHVKLCSVHVGGYIDHLHNDVIMQSYHNTLPDHSKIKLYVNIQVSWSGGPLRGRRQ